MHSWNESQLGCAHRADGRADRERKRAAAGQSGLPEGYRYITLRQVILSQYLYSPHSLECFRPVLPQPSIR